MTILQVEQPATTSGEQLARDDWACKMRLQFSPAGMCDAQGNIIQSFFKPLGLPIIEDRWGPPQQEALLKGIEICGVGNWQQIIASDAALSNCDPVMLRLKTMRCLGTQSLARYQGWKGERTAVEAEHARNKSIGQATGCWKSGMLVEDGHGAVAAALTQDTRQR